MIDHCISTLNKKRKEEAEEKAFREYVTDALMMIAENTTHFVGMQGMIDYGKSFKSRWVELMDYQKPEKDKQEELNKDTRTAEEFASDIWERMKKKKKKRG